jgi:Leucine-rich repeat (LRR) protein
MASLASAMGAMAKSGVVECCVRNDPTLADPAAVATLLSPFMCRANAETLRVLSIEECGLTQEGVHLVAHALRTELPNLTEVTLTQCAELDGDGADALIDACAESHSENIKALTLASTVDTPAGGVSRLPASLGSLAGLRDLGLGFGSLGTDGAAHLLQLLVSAAIPIETLGLRGNHIEHLPGHLIEALPSLNTLWLARNQLDTSAATDLMLALRSTNVTCLSLGKNRISGKLSTPFPPTLTHLWLNDNPIEDADSWSAPEHPFELLNVQGTGLSWDDSSGTALTRTHSSSVEIEFRGQARVHHPASLALAVFLIY